MTQITDVHTYLEQITNVDNECIRVGFNGHPFSMFDKLQSRHVILVKNGEEVAVRMRHQAEAVEGDGAWRISIHSNVRVGQQTCFLKVCRAVAHLLRQDCGQLLP